MNADFVPEAVQELIDWIVQVQDKTHIINPLSEPENHYKILILDLSFLNNVMKKEKVTFEDRKIAIQYFERNCHMTKFDLQWEKIYLTSCTRNWMAGIIMEIF